MLRSIRSQGRLIPIYNEDTKHRFVGPIDDTAVDGHVVKSGAIDLNTKGDAFDLIAMSSDWLPVSATITGIDPGIALRRLVIEAGDLVITQDLTSPRTDFLYPPGDDDHRRLTMQYSTDIVINTAKPGPGQYFLWTKEDSKLAQALYGALIAIRVSVLADLNIETGEFTSAANVQVISFEDIKSDMVEEIKNIFIGSRIGGLLKAYITIETDTHIPEEKPIDTRYLGEDYLSSTKEDGMIDMTPEVKAEEPEPTRRLIPAMTGNNSEYFLFHPKMIPVHHAYQCRGKSGTIMTAPLKLTADCDVIGLHNAGQAEFGRFDQRAALAPEIFISEISMTSGKDAIRIRLYDEIPFAGFSDSPAMKDVKVSIPFVIDSKTQCADGSKLEELNTLLITRSFVGDFYGIINQDTGKFQATMKIRKSTVIVRDHNDKLLDPSLFLDFLRHANFGVTLNARLC